MTLLQGQLNVATNAALFSAQPSLGLMSVDLKIAHVVISGVLRTTNGRNDHDHEMLIYFQAERCSDEIT
jgi:hypothetical protein